MHSDERYTCADPATVRANLVRHADQQGRSLATLSKAVGKNVTYLQKFIERGPPKVLPEDVGLKPAVTLTLDERILVVRVPCTGNML